MRAAQFAARQYDANDIHVPSVAYGSQLLINSGTIACCASRKHAHKLLRLLQCKMLRLFETNVLHHHRSARCRLAILPACTDGSHIHASTCFILYESSTLSHTCIWIERWRGRWWHLISSGNVGPICSVAFGERVVLSVDLERDAKCCTNYLPILHVLEVDTFDQKLTIRIVFENPLQNLYDLYEELTIRTFETWPELFERFASTFLDQESQPAEILTRRAR